MPWSPFILTVLFGVIYGNRLWDYGFERLSAPYAADVKNSDAQRVALLEGIANENSIYENFKELDAPTAQRKATAHPCQPANALEPYYGLIDCVISTEVETNNLLGKMSYEENTKNSNSNSRNPIISLDSKTAYDTLDSTEFSKNGKSKSEPNLSSNIDIPYEMELLRPSLTAISTSNIADFYDDLLEDTKNLNTKRNGAVSTIGCDCKVKNDLLDLGQRHFPRYLLNAVCQSDDNQPRCWRGFCKPLEYKVKVLTFRTVKDHAQKDPAMAWLPDDLRQLWKFKTVTVAAGCFCAIA